MRKALLVAATAAAVVLPVLAAAPASAEPPKKIIGCNDEDAIITIHSPFPDCKPPTD